MRVHVNIAASLDGRLSSRRRKQMTIGGDDDFAHVDEIRATVGAVAVGIGTALADDPRLTFDDPGLVTAREDHDDSSYPARTVTDSHIRAPTNARILNDATTTYLLVSETAPGGQHETLEAAGAELVVAGAERVSLPDTFDALEVRDIDRLMVEGDGELILSLFETGLAGELTLYVGSLVVGGRDTPTLVDGDRFVSDFPRLSLRNVERVNDGVLLICDC